MINASIVERVPLSVLSYKNTALIYPVWKTGLNWHIIVFYAENVIGYVRLRSMAAGSA
jgi:hypothetical protein